MSHVPFNKNKTPRAPKTIFEQPAAAARNAGLQALGFLRAGTVLNSMPRTKHAKGCTGTHLHWDPCADRSSRFPPARNKLRRACQGTIIRHPCNPPKVPKKPSPSRRYLKMSLLTSAVLPLAHRASIPAAGTHSTREDLRTSLLRSQRVTHRAIVDQRVARVLTSSRSLSAGVLLCQNEIGKNQQA